MTDKPKDEIRDLNLAIARLCGIPVAIGAKWDGEPRYVHSDRFGKLWLHLGGARCVQPWSPATDFNQAWEHLAPVLKSLDARMQLTSFVGDDTVNVGIGKPHITACRSGDTPAYAFCLAASTLENDDEDS